MVVVPAEMVRHLEVDRIRDDSLTNMKIDSSEITDMVNKMKKKHEAAKILMKEMGISTGMSPSIVGYTPASTPALTAVTSHPKNDDLKVESHPSEATSSFAPPPVSHSPLIQARIKPLDEITSWIKGKYFDGGYIIDPRNSSKKIKVNSDAVFEYLFQGTKRKAPAGATQLATWIARDKEIDPRLFSDKVKGTLLQFSPPRTRARVNIQRKSVVVKKRNQSGKGTRKWITIH